MEALIAAKLGASVLSAYGKMKAAKAEASLLNAKAEVTLYSAAEQARRMDSLNRELEKDAKVTMGFQETQIAGSGVSSSEGSSLLILEDTANKLATQLVMNERQSRFDQWAAEMEARSLRKSAEDTIEAAKISAFASILGGAADTKKLTS